MKWIIPVFFASDFILFFILPDLAGVVLILALVALNGLADRATDEQSYALREANSAFRRNPVKWRVMMLPLKLRGRK